MRLPDDDLIARVGELVRLGVQPLVAVLALGVSEREFAAWMSRGRDASDGDVCRRLVVEVARAERELEAGLLAGVRAASQWQAQAWLLERRFPERYVRRSVNEKPPATADDDEAPAADPFSEVDNVRPLRPSSKGA